MTFLALLNVLLDIVLHCWPVVVAGDLFVGLVEYKVASCVLAVVEDGFADVGDVGDAEMVFEEDTSWDALEVELRYAVDVVIGFLEFSIIFVGFAYFFDSVGVYGNWGDVGDVLGFVVIKS